MHHKRLMMRAGIQRKFKVRFGEAAETSTRGACAPQTETYSLRIRVRAFTVFGDETVDPRRDNSESIREQAAAVPSRARARHRGTRRARSSNARSRADPKLRRSQYAS